MPEIFGHMPSGEPVSRMALDNGHLRVQVLTFGAVLQVIEVPDRNGARANVVLGLDNLADYIAHSPHFGAVPGRYAGRIDHGRFTLDGVAYQLPVNRPPHTIHGGATGFGRRNWTLADFGPHHAALTLVSPENEDGFPGTVHASVRYSLDGPGLRIDYHAETDRPTIINLTNHSYFNLAGEGSGSILDHHVQIHATHYLPIAVDAIPTGDMLPVDGTPFDFRTPRPIGARIREANIQLQRAQGYDHAYMLPGEGLRIAATLHDPMSGRTLTVQTTEPALQFYSGNSLAGTLAGPSGRIYRSADGVCFEAEHAQDSPNHPDFPSTTLRPGMPFKSTTIFEFSTLPQK